MKTRALRASICWATVGLLAAGCDSSGSGNANLDGSGSEAGNPADASDAGRDVVTPGTDAPDVALPADGPAIEPSLDAPIVVPTLDGPSVVPSVDGADVGPTEDVPIGGQTEAGALTPAQPVEESFQLGRVLSVSFGHATHDTYTAFLAQVRADNVKKVHLAGNIMTF